MRQILYFLTDNGIEPFSEWLDKLKDVKALTAIDRRVRRIGREGYFGDHVPIKGAEGLYELRIFVGPGYRIYYGVDGDQIVVILGGNDKSKQTTAIALAKKHWNQYRNR